jgi:hypothetical protein
MATKTATKGEEVEVPQEEAPHPLAHLIPPPSVGTSYLTRKVGGVTIGDEVRGGKADLNVLAYCRTRSQNEPRLYAPRLVGPTGSGKTFVVRAFAARVQRPLAILSGSDGFDPAEVWGGYIPDPDNPERAIWQNSELLDVVVYGGILYLDEINFLSGDQTAVFHSLLDARRGVTVPQLGNRWFPAHKDLLVVATYNDGYEGTKRLNAAFANRFQLPIEWGYDESVELRLTGSPKLVSIASEIRVLGSKGVITTPVPTNALVDFCELAIDIDVLFALEAFLQRFPANERASVRERFDVDGALATILSEATARFTTS